MDRQKLFDRYGQTAEMTTKEKREMIIPCKLCRYFRHSQKMLVCVDCYQSLKNDEYFIKQKQLKDSDTKVSTVLKK